MHLTRGCGALIRTLNGGGYWPNSSGHWRNFCVIFGLGPARIIRSEVLSVREEVYILAARAVGTSIGRIILRHAHCMVGGRLPRTVYHHHPVRVQLPG
jgi:hypothetical protein